MISIRTFFSYLATFGLLLTLAMGSAYGETDQGGPDGGSASADIVTVAKQSGRYTTFLNLLEKAGMTDKLHADGPYTVFMPTDEAFSQLSQKDHDRLFNLPDESLKRFMNYQIVGGLVPTNEMSDTQHLQALYQQISITKKGDGIKVNDANIVEPDIKANNGIIHGIDKVIEPFFE
ncbi:fasciclin domain-containing protein [Phytohalomonas tamaricis]|uniref:fasciclin domain-containing protein n=1 Tax=Phytohalomonas tamaricis TaxID=2081032 RepID=UPI000D0BDD5A|nr:fasciclin domain-containing protein [Phytohalomonas tamaricis]